MRDIGELLARVEAATEPDREIDIDVCLALNYIDSVNEPPNNLRRSEDDPGWLDYEVMENGKEVDCTDSAPCLTASIDAALALVERMLPGSWYVMAKGRLKSTEPLFGCELLFNHDEQLGIADGHSQPLAILAALLKALSSPAPEGE